MVDVVEEALDVQVTDPVEGPASLPSPTYCIQRRLPRPIAERVGVEQWVHQRFQSILHHHLRDPICDSRDTQCPFPTFCFRNHYRPHRWWKVAARRHSIPDLIKVPFAVPLEVFDRLLIDARCSLVALYLEVGFQDFHSCNTVRFCPVLQAPPIAGWPN